ncbi:superoxide dismutase family protein [Clostridium sp.]|jgi:superoxide dismutase, Cu-Zn family|uniref:superoxide dismutase family protein n=1 Tax=Clostridium sp. TaxID=1506 RepID=UPI0039F46C20
MFYDYGMPSYYSYGHPNPYYNNVYFRNSQDSSIQENWAVAIIKGGPLAPNINGTVYFREVSNGTEVYAYVTGLPEYKPGKGDKPPVGPHGFHIHENGSCEVGNSKDPFKAAGGHWNPTNQPHGNHAGDFPVLFSNNGVARMSFFTNKFKVNDIIGKSIIIHENPDDYRSQPSGNAGKRLACGVIRAV